MGRRGLEPPEAEANDFTDRTATNYGLLHSEIEEHSVNHFHKTIPKTAPQQLQLLGADPSAFVFGEKER